MRVHEWIAERLGPIITASLAVTLGTIAVGFGTSTEREPLAATLWPVLFGAAAIVVAAFGMAPEKDLLYRLGGALAVAAWVSRSFAVELRWIAGVEPTFRAAAWGVLWLFVAFVTGVVWLREVGPWHVGRMRPGTKGG